MVESNYASINSQLGSSLCESEDTEEMFWLRESDDYQSCLALGNALAGQYRFKEAIETYEKASYIKPDDAMLYVRLAGANLTLFRYEEAKKNYEKALAYGAPEKSIAHPFGVWHYLKGDYQSAAKWFSKCLPCDGEMEIAVIYWHTLASYRAGVYPELLKKYHSGMDVGHHVAYKTAVSVFSGECEWNEAHAGDNDLDAAIVLYGLSAYLDHIGQADEAKKYLEKTLQHDSVWPCISYLAAWNDSKTVL